MRLGVLFGPLIVEQTGAVLINDNVDAPRLVRNAADPGGTGAQVENLLTDVAQLVERLAAEAHQRRGVARCQHDGAGLGNQLAPDGGK